jgi:hypothetical protein
MCCSQKVSFHLSGMFHGQTFSFSMAKLLCIVARMSVSAWLEYVVVKKLVSAWLEWVLDKKSVSACLEYVVVKKLVSAAGISLSKKVFISCPNHFAQIFRGRKRRRRRRRRSRRLAAP